jgi:hypothetical protein
MVENRIEVYTAMLPPPFRGFRRWLQGPSKPQGAWEGHVRALFKSRNGPASQAAATNGEGQLTMRLSSFPGLIRLHTVSVPGLRVFQ